MIPVGTSKDTATDSWDLIMTNDEVPRHLAIVVYYYARGGNVYVVYIHANVDGGPIRSSVGTKQTLTQQTTLYSERSCCRPLKLTRITADSGSDSVTYITYQSIDPWPVTHEPWPLTNKVTTIAFSSLQSAYVVPIFVISTAMSQTKQFWDDRIWNTELYLLYPP